MKDEPEIIFQANRDALADASQLKHLLAFYAADRRLGCPQEREPGDLHAGEGLAEDPFLQRFKVNGDVRQFGHKGLRLF